MTAKRSAVSGVRVWDMISLIASLPEYREGSGSVGHRQQ
jgi:hypothetical protein